MAEERKRPVMFKVYPMSHVLAYDGVTGAHYLLGALGIMLGWGFGWPALTLGAGYLVFAFGQMYVIMPLKVCPCCVYYRLEDGRCVSGNNLLSRRIAKQGDPKDFEKRAGSPLCHNNLYIASLLLPLVLMGPTLYLNFSWSILGLFLSVLVLLLVRFFVLFPKVACVHCMAKARCPNARSMGLS